MYQLECIRICGVILSVSNTIDVYYSNRHAIHYPLLDIEPSFLYNDVNISDYGMYYGCPANTSILNRLIVVKSPVDLEYEIADGHSLGQDLIFTPRAPDFVKEFLNAAVARTETNKFLVQLKLVSSFISAEEPLIATVLPPFLHDSSIKLHKFLPGEYDISKWFRSLHPALALQSDKHTVRVKRGQALFYIMLNTEKKINLIPYQWTEKLDEYLVHCNDVSKFTPKKNLKYRYNLYQDKKFDVKILDEIKKSLT